MKSILTKILTKYNGAFGYYKAVFASAGIPAMVLLAVSLWGLFSGKIPNAFAVGFLVASLIVLLISALIIMNTLPKCPAERRNVVLLILNMALVAFLGGFIRNTPGFFKGVFAIINGTMAGSAAAGFANQYIRDRDGAHFFLHSDNGTYAYLNSNGNIIAVRPHGSDGLVCDDEGNLYHPC